jgi:hypothetical protein
MDKLPALAYVVAPFLGFAVFAIAARLLSGSMDKDRIRAHLAKRGGRMLSANWAPFGKGWLGEESDRIYVVHYQDLHGDEHRAHCKTRMFSGVYFADDEIVRHGVSRSHPSLRQS